MKQIYVAFFVIASFVPAIATAQKAVYTDTAHYSETFGRSKYYRLYLPEGYSTSQRKYPVIYFFHGWGGRHYKDDNALLEYEKIKHLVDKYQVLLVMWDGNIDTTEPRPYNTGDHPDVKFQVQMKDYFPELVAHVDSSYRTLSDRYHRGIIGFSMGGFMSFFLAGKYPDKVCAAVSLAGSPEFFVGYPENHTLYPVRYTFKNLSDVNIRLHNGDSDILYYLNDEVNEGAKWEGIKLDYWKFQGGHMVDKTGETKVFEMAMKFVTGTFNNKRLPGPRWSHYDLYPEFSVWDYQVNTNKKQPGYILLKHVDKSGFGIYTQQWLPDGPATTTDSLSVRTAPLYTPGKSYSVINYITRSGKFSIDTQTADANGCLSFVYGQGGIETGIFENTGGPSFIISGHHIDNGTGYLRSGKSHKISLKLFNRGNNSSSTKIKVTVSATDSAVHIAKATREIVVPAGRRSFMLPAYTVVCNKKKPLHAEPPQVKLIVTIQNADQSVTDELIVPVQYEASLFKNVRVDDQLAIREKAFGEGNGNGVAEAGETVMIYSGSHRLRLYTADKWVSEQTTDEMVPARWPDGFTLNSLLTISPHCPDGHVIELYGSYETKSFDPIERKTTWGKLKLTVRNKRY